MDIKLALARCQQAIVSVCPVVPALGTTALENASVIIVRILCLPSISLAIAYVFRDANRCLRLGSLRLLLSSLRLLRLSRLADALQS